jgi:hypothetical protein
MSLEQQGRRLREAFQGGSDLDMLDIIGDAYGGLLLDLIEALPTASDRTLTYAAPQLADLAIRVGALEGK